MLRVEFGMSARAAARIANGWTQEDAVVEWQRRWPDHPIDTKKLSTWECWPVGGHAPSLDNVRRLAQLYGVRVADLVDDLDLEPETEDDYDDPVDRREFLGGIVTLPAAAMLGKSFDGQRLTRSDVARLRTQLRAVIALDDRDGGRASLDRAREISAHVRTLASSGECSTVVARDLHVLSGEFGHLAAWSAFDAGDLELSRSLAGDALVAGQITGDQRLIGMVLATMTLSAAESGAGREAIELGRAAQRAAAPYASSRLMSLLLAREARGHAVVGDGPECYRLLAEAERLFDEDEPHPDEEWITAWVPSNFLGAVSAAHLALGANRDALAAAESALTLNPHRLRRNQGLYLSRIALSRAATGELDGAAEAVTAARRLGLSSARVNRQLDALAPMLEKR